MEERSFEVMQAFDLGPCRRISTLLGPYKEFDFTFPVIQKPGSVDEDMTPVVNSLASYVNLNLISAVSVPKTLPAVSTHKSLPPPPSLRTGPWS